jgi:hypothetical protein
MQAALQGIDAKMRLFDAPAIQNTSDTMGVEAATQPQTSNSSSDAPAIETDKNMVNVEPATVPQILSSSRETAANQSYSSNSSA